jgi:hypothetical protein
MTRVLDVLFLMSVPEFINTVFAKTSPDAHVQSLKTSVFGLVFTKTGPITSGTGGFFSLDVFHGVLGRNISTVAKHMILFNS